MVIELDAISLEEPGEWVEYAVDSAGAVLASAKQFIHQRSQTANRMSGDESAISSGGAAPGYTADSRSVSGRIAGDGSRRDGVRRARH